MLHLFRFVKGLKAADGRIRRVLGIEKILEGEFFEARVGETREFRACERPRHLAFRFGRFAAACDDKQVPAGAEESRNIFDRAEAKGGRQNLERIGLKDEMESATPSRRRLEQVGGEVFDSGSGKALTASANRGFRYIERRGTETPCGELLGIVAKAAADGQRRFAGSFQGMRAPKMKQARIGAQTSPRNSALPCFAFPVELLEPPDGIALAIEFGD